MQKIKVLQVIGSLHIGGAENMAMNILRYIDRGKYQIDFLVFDGTKENSFESEAISLGANIIMLNKPSLSYREFYKNIKKLLQDGKYDVVHSHTLFNNGIILKAASAVGVKARISHSHSTNSGRNENITYRVYIKIMRSYINRYATHLIACGKDAGTFLYENKRFIVIKNGVNISDYKCNIDIRLSMRNQLGLGDKFVIGHVGRFAKVKNHDFLLDVFLEVHKIIPNSILLLVGDGELREEIINKIDKYNLKNYVILTGLRDDVNNLMQAMDILLLPSLYEGIPLTLIEAQASGLKCIISDNVSDEVCITDDVYKLSLDNKSKWINKILEYSKSNNRNSNNKNLIDSGYDIKTSIKKLENIYEDAINSF